MVNCAGQQVRSHWSNLIAAAAAAMMAATASGACCCALHVLLRLLAALDVFTWQIFCMRLTALSAGACCGQSWQNPFWGLCGAWGTLVQAGWRPQQLDMDATSCTIVLWYTLVCLLLAHIA